MDSIEEQKVVEEPHNHEGDIYADAHIPDPNNEGNWTIDADAHIPAPNNEGNRPLCP